MKIETLMKKHKKEELAAMLLAAQEELEKFNKGVLFHSNGNINHTTFLVDGKPPEDITTVRIWANVSDGVEVSYETLKDWDLPYERIWVYGEKEQLTKVFREYKRLKDAERQAMLNS
ncbi:hypothetical protein [Niallia sp. FSL W8-0954]|uniref:hypothetical protein n=1 Tax=Niallia sp. FSL W8-0954 TaxID=2975338 RepID=UPI0030F608F0